LLHALPADVQELAGKTYHLWRLHPRIRRSASEGYKGAQIVLAFASATTTALSVD
jgi:hypothetical protein